MKRALLNPIFSDGERRLGSFMGTTMWLVSATMLVVLWAWSAGPS